jgi:hypothetical protein
MAWLAKFFRDLFFKWLFSPSGIATVGAFVAITMTGLSFFSVAMQAYAPLSYGVVALLSMAIAMWILNMCLNIWSRFAGIYTTREQTLIEYRVHDGRLNLISKKNIYKEPNSNVSIPHTVHGSNRQEKRALAARNEPVITRHPADARIIVMFEKPIHPSSFLCRIEPVAGESPIKNTTAMDERYAIIEISNLHDGAQFRIVFN